MWLHRKLKWSRWGLFSSHQGRPARPAGDVRGEGELVDEPARRRRPRRGSRRRTRPGRPPRRGRPGGVPRRRPGTLASGTVRRAAGSRSTAPPSRLGRLPGRLAFQALHGRDARLAAAPPLDEGLEQLQGVEPVDLDAAVADRQGAVELDPGPEHQRRLPPGDRHARARPSSGSPARATGRTSTSRRRQEYEKCLSL